MNGLGSFHRIGTVAVPQGSRPEWGLTGTDWDWDWRAGGLATLRLPKPRNPMSWAMGSGHLATCPIQAKRTCTYRRTVPEYIRGYQDATVHTSTATSIPTNSCQYCHVPLPDIMPQTGGQRAFRQVHPGPLRFHPPTPQAP